MLARLARNGAALRNALLDVLFPPRCVVCRQRGTWLCASCVAQFERIVPPICERCGRPLHRTTCPYCARAPLHIEGTRAVAFFDGALRQAIHAFKYLHRTELADYFGTMLADYLLTFPLSVDTIIAVPLHPERERARGYNQAALLANALGARTHLPVWNDALVRTRATRSQTELNAEERYANVHDAFAASPRVRGARVLLIDDVCTTGATMQACGAALYAQGAQTVWGLTLARSR
ncbi:MAG: ComF family protein [Anaerolineae bacterium]|nr:ComF family protein [Anaerolineae bacterium]